MFSYGQIKIRYEFLLGPMRPNVHQGIVFTFPSDLAHKEKHKKEKEESARKGKLCYKVYVFCHLLWVIFVEFAAFHLKKGKQTHLEFRLWQLTVKNVKCYAQFLFYAFSSYTSNILQILIPDFLHFYQKENESIPAFPIIFVSPLKISFQQ